MRTFLSPGTRPVRAESEQEAAWQFAFRLSNLDRGYQRASRPTLGDDGKWVSTVATKEGPLLVALTVTERSKNAKTRRAQSLRGFCKLT